MLPTPTLHEQPAESRPSRNLFARIPAELYDDLDTYLREEKILLRLAVKKALEEFLRKRGFLTAP
jgi:hypothetical protein